jgi:hypothetical protein
MLDPDGGVAEGIGLGATEDGVDETGFRRRGVAFGEFDGLVDGGVGGGAEEMELVEAEVENVADDGAGRVGDEVGGDEVEGELLAEATVEKFGGKAAVSRGKRGGREFGFEEFIRQPARLGPLLQ